MFTGGFNGLRLRLEGLVFLVLGLGVGGYCDLGTLRVLGFRISRQTGLNKLLL